MLSATKLKQKTFKKMNVFNQIKIENNLDSAQLDEVINLAFGEIARKHPNIELEYNEDGINILSLNENESIWVGATIDGELEVFLSEKDADKSESVVITKFSKFSFEKSLTDELLSIANRKL